LGIRAASSNDCARAFNRQSQRVTLRSPFWTTLFHPVPSHSGQTSTDTFMAEMRSPHLTLHRTMHFPQAQFGACLCTSCGALIVTVEGGGKMEGAEVSPRRPPLIFHFCKRYYRVFLESTATPGYSEPMFESVFVR